jgi:hypothetical protein
VSQGGLDAQWLDNRQRGRELAGRLADNAEALAVTIDRAADLHEMVSSDPNHPLRASAGAHVERERRFAAAERLEAAHWRRYADDPGRGAHPGSS